MTPKESSRLFSKLAVAVFFPLSDLSLENRIDFIKYLTNLEEHPMDDGKLKTYVLYLLEILDTEMPIQNIFVKNIIQGGEQLKLL